MKKLPILNRVCLRKTAFYSHYKEAIVPVNMPTWAKKGYFCGHGGLYMFMGSMKIWPRGPGGPLVHFQWVGSPMLVETHMGTVA